MGPHLGPKNDKIIDKNEKKTYHKSKLLCCKHPLDPHKGPRRVSKSSGAYEWANDCVYGMRYDPNATAAMRFSDQVLKDYKP